MILQELTLENIGVFKGIQSLDFTTNGSKQPITLVGALNGGGKTTILQALQLALFGNKTKNVLPRSMSYKNYIRSRIINEDIKANDVARITLTFNTIEFGQPVEYRLERSWKKTKDCKEHFEVYVDDKYSPQHVDNWNQEIDKILPPNIAKLFFYDGEQIEMMADPEQSAHILKEGIYSLLGIDIVETLQADLKRAVRDKQKSVSPKVRAEIEAIESVINKHQQKIKQCKDKKASLLEAMDRIDREKKKVDEQFESKGGAVWVELDQINTQLTDLKQTNSVNQHELQNWVAGSSPLLMLQDQLQLLLSQAENEHQQNVALALNQTLEDRDQELLQAISKKATKTTKKTIQSIEAFLSKDRNERQRSISDMEMAWLGISDSTQLKLKGLLDGEAKQLKRQVAKLQKNYDKNNADIEALEDSIEGMDSNSTVHQGYIKNSAKLEAEENQKRTAIAELDQEILKFQDQMQEQEKKLTHYADTLLADEDISRFVAYTQRILTSLDSYRKNKLKKHIESLEHSIGEAYRTLLRKQSLVDRVTINPESFALTVFNDKGRSKLGHKLSAAERQLLSVAMLWGLARASGRILPVVIDTPLGRLDGDHRPNIVEEYFPEASHQVILLSTDTEIDKSLHQQLKNKIAHEYLLQFSDKTKSSTIKQGYFWH